jgi:hypothetical protein
MPADYAQALQTAAAEALTLVPSSVTTTQKPPPTVVDQIPAGKHTNPIWVTAKLRCRDVKYPLYGGYE